MLRRTTLALFLLLLTLAAPAWADTPTHALPDVTRQRQVWSGDLHAAYVVAGCLPSVPGGLTFAAFACEGYVRDTTTDENLYVAQAAAQVGPLSSGNGTYWLALHRDTRTSVSSWTRQSGTHYLWRLSASQPTTPTGATLLARVTVAGGVITAVADFRPPASWARAGVYDITDPLYGAVGDGTTDAASALETALAAAPDGAVVYVPPGTFVLTRNVFVTRSNVTLQGAGFASIVKAKAGFTNTSNKGLVSFGYSPALGVTAISNILVRDLTLDGTSLAKALEFLSVTRGTISHVQAKNAGLTHPVIHTEVTTDLLIEHCLVSGALGEFGDGILAAGATRPKILHNTVSDFTRIGIVTESSGATLSSDVLIAGNHIRDAHNATGSESNAAIWLENTSGGQVIGNVGEDLHDTPGALVSKGIVIAAGGAAGSRFEVLGNVISGAQYGLLITAGTTHTVLVHGLSVRRGTLTNYVAGVAISAAYNVSISQLHLGDNNYQAASHGGVVVDLTANMNELSLVDGLLGEVSGMAYTAATAADVNLFSLGGFTLTSLTLRNLHFWKVQMVGFPTILNVSGSKLTYDASSIKALGATSRLTMAQSLLAQVSGSGGYSLHAVEGTLYQFSDVTFSAADMTLAHAGAGTHTLTFTGCHFTNGTKLNLDGRFDVTVANSRWDEYPTSGAIRANFTNVTLTLRIRDTAFTRTTDVTPIVLWNFAPTLLLQDVNYSSTLLTDITTAVESMTQAVVQANLGTRGNGSVRYCSDCTVTGAGDNTCAAAGTGALAMRLNGVWRCFNAQN